MNRRRSLRRLSLLPMGAFRYVPWISCTLCWISYGFSRPMRKCLYWLIPQRKKDASSDQSQRTNGNLSVSSTKPYECFRLFVPSRYKYWLKLTITPQATGIPKVAAEDTSLVAGNIHGEKKSIPISKGTEFVIDIIGTHYNRTYLVFSWCLVHILMMESSKQQLVTGKIRIHSILHVFSKIGLVTPFCLLVLVRKSFLHLSKSTFFFII